MSTPEATKTPATPTLDSLAKAKTEGITKFSTFRINPDKIKFQEGFNLRQDTDETSLHIDRLYESMKNGAMIPPIEVQIINGEITARTGHCRTKAAQRLKLEMPEYTLECRQLRGNEQDAVLHMLGSDTGGKPLTPLEAGFGYLRLTKMGLTPVQIAGKLGVSRVTIDNGLTLAEADTETQQMVASGEVSSTTAREAIKQGAEGVEALKTAVKAERANPTKKKSGKKGKVTAKKLKGTKAAKVKPVKADKAKPSEDPKPTTEEGKISIFIDKGTATATLEWLKIYAADDEPIKPFINALETALL